VCGCVCVCVQFVNCEKKNGELKVLGVESPETRHVVSKGVGSAGEEACFRGQTTGITNWECCPMSGYVVKQRWRPLTGSG